MPYPFTGPKVFLFGPKFFVHNQKFIYICARHKGNLHSLKLVFVPALSLAGTKVFEEALYAVKF